MRFYTCVFVIFSVLINSTGTTFIHLNYLIQKRKIVEQLCINKNKPELKCDGKCYLAKELKKTEENAEKSGEKLSKAEEFFESKIANLNHPSFHFQRNIVAKIGQPYCANYAFVDFEPPKS
jgi:hypothetical protein